jgi:hypothetical protein
VPRGLTFIVVNEFNELPFTCFLGAPELSRIPHTGADFSGVILVFLASTCGGVALGLFSPRLLVLRMTVKRIAGVNVRGN